VTNIKSEQRKSVRYRLRDVAVIGIINPTSSAPELVEDIRTTDFNVNGIGIETCAQLNIGDKLSLAIKTGNEETSIITATVCNRATTNGDTSRYGLLFDYSSELNNKNVDSHLKSIEAEANPKQRRFTFSGS
jgi:hypothetical protein